MITAFLIEALRQHFQELRIEDSDLRKHVWRALPVTGILIEDIFRWQNLAIEKRPSVVVKPNKETNERRGIGDLRGEDTHGNRYYETFWVGSHTVFCVHGSSRGAEAVASEVKRELHHFGATWVQYLNLHRFQVVDVDAPQEIEEARESYAVPITVGWIYSDLWMVSAAATRMESPKLTVLLDGFEI